MAQHIYWEYHFALVYFDAYPVIGPWRGYALNEQMVHYYSPSAIRDMIKAWHPVLFSG